MGGGRQTPEHITSASLLPSGFVYKYLHSVLSPLAGLWDWCIIALLLGSLAHVVGMLCLAAGLTIMRGNGMLSDSAQPGSWLVKNMFPPSPLFNASSPHCWPRTTAKSSPRA